MVFLSLPLSFSLSPFSFALLLFFLKSIWSVKFNYYLDFSQAQYHDSIKILEIVSRYKTYIEVSHLRPVASVKESCYLWWRYAAQASLQQKKMW